MGSANETSRKTLQQDLLPFVAERLASPASSTQRVLRICVFMRMWCSNCFLSYVKATSMTVKKAQPWDFHHRLFSRRKKNNEGKKKSREWSNNNLGNPSRTFPDLYLALTKLIKACIHYSLTGSDSFIFSHRTCKRRKKNQLTIVFLAP